MNWQGGPPGGDRGLSDMLNSPMVQSLMNSPEFLQTLISGNPAIREVRLRLSEPGFESILFSFSQHTLSAIVLRIDTALDKC